MTKRGCGIVSQTGIEPNEIVRFMEGRWTTTDIIVVPGKTIQQKKYIEIMKIKSPDTLTITAEKFENGKDLTRDMTIELGDKVSLKQGDFVATGSREGNAIMLSGALDNRTYNFRIYLMKDKFVFQRDVLEHGRIVEAQMSHVIRNVSP